MSAVVAGSVTGIDMNSDMGESFGRWKLGDDEALLDVVSSANVACGFHAGDPSVMLRTLSYAASREVMVGAHVAYRDLAGFGRRYVDESPDELKADVMYQIAALEGMARSVGAQVRYVKPHGALYNRIVRDESQAAADRTSSHLANALVGNPANTPVLEITGGGVRMRAIGSVVVAVTGASADVTITGSRQSQDSQGGSNGTFTPNSPGGCSGRTVLNASNDAADRTTIAMQQPVLLRDGDVLSIAPPTSGLRDYVAVRGGFGVATTLGSAATDTMSGIGPRPIAAKQRLAIRTASTACDAGVGLPQPWPTDLPKPGRPTDLYVRLGPRDDWFTAAGLSAFLTQTWTVTAQSNRVGLRLSGAAPVERTDTRELASEATPSGAIEVPTSGQPVIFLRDQPVTGGYPVIAVLEPESLDVAGQLPPGACVRFHVVSAHVTSTPQPAYPTKEVR